MTTAYTKRTKDTKGTKGTKDTKGTKGTKGTKDKFKAGKTASSKPGKLVVSGFELASLISFEL